MAFKLKSALKFGQKGTYKQKTYNSPNKQKQQKGDPVDMELGPDKRPGWSSGRVANRKKKKDMDGMLKEWLMTNRGFNQEDADRMIADGAYTHKDMFKDVPAEGKSPNKQEGPIDKKNPKLQPGEMEGTWIYGRGYKDEDYPTTKGEGFNPTGTRDEQHTANERIIDLEERISFLHEDLDTADDEYLGGGNAKKGAKIRKTKENTIKNLQHEVDIMRKRRENERSAVKQKETQDTWEPAYEGGDHSWKDLQKMSDKDIMKNWPDVGKHIIKDLHKKGYRKKKGEAGPIKQTEGNPDVLNPDLPEDVKRRIGDKPTPAKQKRKRKPRYDVNETDKRVYKIDQTRYDKWREEHSPESPDIRYLGAKENNEHIEKYWDYKKSKKKPEPVYYPSPNKHMEDDDSFPHEHGPDDGIVFPKGKKSPAKHHTKKKPVKKVPRKKVQHMPISEEGREIDSTNAEKARGEVYSWDPRQTKRLTEEEDKQAFIKESTPSSMKRKKYK
jgi:hypothetical protein